MKHIINITVSRKEREEVPIHILKKDVLKNHNSRQEKSRTFFKKEMNSLLACGTKANEKRI